jgi:hypothetical protein
MVWFLSGKNKIEPENGCYLFFHLSAYYKKTLSLAIIAVNH